MGSHVLFPVCRWLLLEWSLKPLHSSTRRARLPYNTCTRSHLVRLVSARESGRVSSRAVSTVAPLRGDPALLEYSEMAEEDSRDVLVVPEFVSAAEGESLLQEISRVLRGKRYLYDHWDGAIEGYRETEKTRWSEPNMPVVRRLKETVMEGGDVVPLDEVHVLDLAQDGFIKPHIDSVKFCGDTIAGLSLVSVCVMVFQHETDTSRWIRALLPPLSLYVMRGSVRYSYTHAVPLVHDQLWFKGQKITRDQRISVISRTHPNIK